MSLEGKFTFAKGSYEKNGKGQKEQKAKGHISIDDLLMVRSLLDTNSDL